MFNITRKLARRGKAYNKLMKRRRIQQQVQRWAARRHRAEARFKLCGLAAIALSCFFLVVLLYNIISHGYTAFVQTQIRLPISFSADVVDSKNYIQAVHRGLDTLFPNIDDRRSKQQLYSLVSKGASSVLQNMEQDNPALYDTSQDVWLLASSDIDMVIKGHISADLPESDRRVSDQQLYWIGKLREQGSIRTSFNWTFFTSGDSREPEMAGMLGSAVGSFFVVISCMLLAFPLGVMTAIYLEEFAPKNRLTALIEVNLNNLAAVPSIVFGLLGLAVYIQTMGIPRSASLAGGLTLALMALPVIVIATRTSIRAVPRSICEGAMALGASKLQTVMHHIIPLAMPGIMTGTILSIARILGETAPLLMIGMVAFIVDVPTGFLSPSTAMPVQIYLWSDSAEPGFIEKTSAAIMVLLAFLVMANAVAAYLRKKFETRW